MLSLLLVDPLEKEREQLRYMLQDEVASISDEYWDILCLKDPAVIEKELADTDLLDFACVDVVGGKAMDGVYLLRKKYAEMFLLLIADAKLSPLTYLQPGVRPDSLLLRPLDKATVKRTLNDFLTAGLERKEDPGEENCFTVKNKEERTYIPYRSICYFEAREKKVFARTLNEEYGFYDSLEEMADTLPEEFVRCHRSFIVNTKMIKKVIAAQNIILLSEDVEVPLSRSYKTKFREFKK